MKKVSSRLCIADELLSKMVRRCHISFEVEDMREVFVRGGDPSDDKTISKSRSSVLVSKGEKKIF